jgi:EAL and modified HD-GYP domain-containing signal transduction protein
MPTEFPLVTLQPITDARQAWVALLLASSSSGTTEQLGRVCGEFGLTDALGPLPVVVMVPGIDIDASAFRADRTILCPPVAICTDAASFPALTALKAAGFRFMAAGLPQAGQTVFEGTTGFVLPCPGKGAPSGMGEWLGKLPGPHLALGAEEITCPGRCHFTWFAGNFPEMPAPTPSRTSDAPNRALLLDLLGKVTSDADSGEIEAIVKRDPQLSYHLLKLVNSVGFALNHKIGSFTQAITLLGRRQLQRWLQLLLYARTQKDGAANPLLPRAAMRAGLMECLCQQCGGSREDQDRAFMVGMFSMLDRLFGMPLGDIVTPLNLSDELVSGLTEHGGRLGAQLTAVEAGEGMPGERLAAALDAAGITGECWARALAHASHWAVQVSQEA